MEESTVRILNALEVHSYWSHIGVLGVEDVVIERARQRDGTWLWKIVQGGIMDGPVLNRDLEWEYNSLPSSRTDEELARTRYPSLGVAVSYLEKYVESAGSARLVPPAEIG